MGLLKPEITRKGLTRNGPALAVCCTQQRALSSTFTSRPLKIRPSGIAWGLPSKKGEPNTDFSRRTKVRELPCGNFCVGPGAWRGGLCGCNQSFLRRKGGGVLLGCLPCGSCHPSRDAEPDAARLKLWAQRGGGSPVLDTTNSPDDVSDGKASGYPVGPECSSRPGRPQRHDPQEKRNSSR